MRLVHRPRSADGDEERTLASDVDLAETTFEQGRGLMFRRSIPDDYALVFPFKNAKARTLHMIGVPFAIDAVWIVDEEVSHVKRLAPMIGLGRGTADCIVELPAGAAEGVAVGDAVRLVE
ncbi:DUF192 domain-containing protein [Halorubrum vacuolatum]|uniref:DUF192 domain-containing protein n=1 Tax=Halorubrum vacuolatum TaxID=63740 RepID=A0A238WTP2_HALVU|nr:DUF192 domain-containing protein [Halorubrum vacuolatum]SNR48989.1 hypothetical protein SAMN06264855_10999 [Halorubrum vacuolatum]